MTDSSAPAVLLPDVDEVNRPFWEAATGREFLLYTCANCQSRYYPATECTRCDDLSPPMSWQPASGRGRLISWIVMHRAYHDAFKDRVPYNVALVQVDEGPYFLTNIVGCDQADLRYEMPVAVEFEEVAPGVTLPRFRPLREGAP
jgi:uncharacterized OB-fold protein